MIILIYFYSVLKSSNSFCHLHIQVPRQEKKWFSSICIVAVFFPLFSFFWWTAAIQREGHSFEQMNVWIIDSGANLLPATEANGLASGYFKRVCALLMMSNPHRKSICVLFRTVLSLLRRLYCRRNGHEFLRTRKEGGCSKVQGVGAGIKPQTPASPVSC